MAGDAVQFGFSQRAGRTDASPINDLIQKVLETPGLISLAAGLVDEETLPCGAVAGLVQGVLAADTAGARAAMQYGSTAGLAELRARVLEHIAALDGACGRETGGRVEDLVIATGSQQLLYILGELLIDPGDIVLVGWPDYFVYTGALASFGAQFRAVEMDEEGLVPEALERVLGGLEAAGQLGRVKLLYVCSYYQNPTGLTLSESRRPVVLGILRRFSRGHRILLIEDAAYRELSYGGTSPASIRSFDIGGRFVAYVGTFSKPFAPGLKTGYGLLPSDLAEKVVLQKGHHDFGSASFCQYLLLEAMKSGVYQGHVAMIRRHYALKCRAMLEALERHLGGLCRGRIHWTRPSGGMYVWVTLAEEIETGPGSPLFRRAMEKGVLYVPGEYCYPPEAGREVPRHQMRLSFGTPSLGQIEEGVVRLTEAIRGL